MTKMLRELDVALAITERDGKLLLIQRKHSEPQWDKKWEFPGGKIQPGEIGSVAALRELREETGLESPKAIYLGLHHHDWHLTDRILRVHIHCFACQAGKGNVVLEMEKAYDKHWVDPWSALSYDMLAPNRFILEQLYFPHAGLSNVDRN